MKLLLQTHPIPRFHPGRVGGGLALLAVSLMLLASGCSKEGRILNHLNRANQFFTSDRFLEAEIEYKNALRLDPTNQVAVSRLGIIYHDQGLLLPGILFLGRAKALNPEDLDVRFRFGFSLLVGQRREEARQEAEFILSRNPAHDEALMLLAETAVTTNEIADMFQKLEQLRPQAQDRAGFHLALGTLHYRTHNMSATEAALKQALLIDPKSSAAHASLGNYYWREGNLADAERFFLAAADLAPLRSHRRLRYGEFKLRTGDVAGGKEFIEGITRQTPDYLPAWARLAEQAYEEKDYEACLELLSHVLERDRTHFDALLIEGRVLLSQNHLDAGIKKLEDLNKQFPNVPKVLYPLAAAKLAKEEVGTAQDLLDQAIARDPSGIDPSMLKARLAIRQGRNGEAISVLSQLLGFHPRLAQAHLLLATAQLRNGQPQESLKIYEQLDTLYPESPQAPYSMGLVYQYLKQPDVARREFARALDRSPVYIPALEQLVEMDIAEETFQTARERVEKAMREEDTRGHEALLQLLLAKTYYAEKDFSAAEGAAQRAISLRPSLRPAYMLLTRVAIATGNHQQALDKMNALLQTDPKDVAALFQVGMIHEALKDYAGARAAYLKLLEVDDRFAPALNNLAYINSEELNDLEQAYQLARKAAALAPEDPSVADTLGWIYFKRGEYRQALTPLQQAVAGLPQEPVVHYHLGMVHYMRNEEALARRAFDTALSFNQEFPGRSDIPIRLDRLSIDPLAVDAPTVAALNEALQSEPSDPILLRRLAAIHLRDGELAEAVALFERALAVDPNNVGIHVNLVELYSSPLVNQHDKAITMAKKARDLAPNDAAIAGRLGRLAMAAGDTSWALPLLRECSRETDADPEVLYDLARCHYALGQLVESQVALERVLNLNIPFSRAAEARQFRTLLEAHLTPLKRFELAPTLDPILQSRPDYVPALYLAALQNESRQQLDQARDRYRRILSLEGYDHFMLAHRSLAILLVAMFGDSDEAHTHATKAREAYPDDPDVAKALGIIMHSRNEPARSAQLLNEAARKITKDPEVFYYLGLSLLELNRKGEAALALEKSLELNDKTPYAIKALQALTQARTP